jgi:hypothetical protein
MQAQQVLDAVLQRDPLADQPFAFPLRSPYVLFGLARDVHHRAHPRLAAQPSQQRAQQHVEIDTISLDAAPSAFDRDARRMHHPHLSAMRQQIPRDPEAVPTRFIGQHDPAYRAARSFRLGLPPVELLQQLGHVAWRQAPARAAAHAG